MLIWKTVGEATLHRWMEANWSSHLQQLLVFDIFSHGWILFRVKTEEEKQKILNNSWQWVPSGMILKKWKVDFEADREP